MKNLKLHVGKVYISVLLCAIAVSGCSKLHGTIPGMSNSEFPRNAPPGSIPVDTFAPMADSEQWQVIRVSDGDTIVVRQMDGQEKKLRFCGIDAPEKSQPLGKESKANLQKLVDEVDGTVMITPIESDRYGRTVAEIFSSKNGIEKSLNSEQLSSGNAYLYKQYAGKCPNKLSFESAEAIAQSGHLGVWSGNFEKPWDYRKRLRGN